MTVNFDWGAVGVILAILIHEGAIIWWAATMTASIKNVHTCIEGIDNELKKRDQEMFAYWKKTDAIDHRVTILETKYSNK